MIIIIDNYDSFTYNLYQSIAQHVETRVFRNDKISIDEIEKLNPSGIIISPGPGRPENAGICVELVKKLGHKIPILGICLGHQAIAYAFGCEIKRDVEIVHGKASLVHHINDELFKDVPKSFTAGRYHSLTVDTNSIPADITITSICNKGSVMSIKHEQYPCYGIQFHPESILTPDGEKILTNFLKLCNVGDIHVDLSHQQAHAA